MGVYIKGMTLKQFNEFMDILGGIMNPSKLIEVTEPHGRLIDADKLKPSHYEEIYADDEYVYRYYSEDDIGTAPTVIEAEGME